MFFVATQYLSFLLLSNNTLFQWFKWIGNVWLIFAATAVAVSADWSQEVWPFIMYTLGAGMWVCAGILMRDKALVGLNAYFVLFDGYAIIIRL